jgi:hypothetical protein
MKIFLQKYCIYYRKINKYLKFGVYIFVFIRKSSIVDWRIAYLFITIVSSITDTNSSMVDKYLLSFASAKFLKLINIIITSSQFIFEPGNSFCVNLIFTVGFIIKRLRRNGISSKFSKQVWFPFIIENWFCYQIVVKFLYIIMWNRRVTRLQTLDEFIERNVIIRVFCFGR